MRYHWIATVRDVKNERRSVWNHLISELESNPSNFKQISSIYGKPAITKSEAIRIEKQIIDDFRFRISKVSEWSNNSLNNFNQVKQLSSFQPESPPSTNQPVKIPNTTPSSISSQTVSLNFQFFPHAIFIMLIIFRITSKRKQYS